MLLSQSCVILQSMRILKLVEFNTLIFSLRDCIVKGIKGKRLSGNAPSFNICYCSVLARNNERTEQRNYFAPQLLQLSTQRKWPRSDAWDSASFAAARKFVKPRNERRV